jgi:hypothetical protein
MADPAPCSSCKAAPSLAKGLCRRCYDQARRDAKGGTRTIGRPVTDPLDLFWSQVWKMPGDDECWMWQGTVDSNGYGRFKARTVSATGRVSYRTRLAHRWIWRRTVGPLSRVYNLDHLCHNRDLRCKGGPTCPHRLCVRVSHLEKVRPEENQRRRAERAARVKAVTTPPLRVLHHVSWDNPHFDPAAYLDAIEECH